MTAKRKAKAHALLAKQSAVRSNEPQLDTENYNLSIGQILQWYTEHSTEKQRRKYALEHFAKQKGNLKLVTGVEFVALIQKYYADLDLKFRQQIPLRNVLVPDVARDQI